MPFTALTAPPTAPDVNDPTTFNTRALAYVAWWQTSNTELNNLVTLLNSYSGVTGSYQFTDGAAATPAVTFAAGTGVGLFRAGTNVLGVSTAGVEALRVTSAQNVLVGSTNTILGTGAAKLTIQGSGAVGGTFAHMRATADANGVLWDMVKTRGAAVDTYTIVNNGDTLGTLRWRGGDGSTSILSASLAAIVEVAPAAGDVRAGLSLSVGTAAGVLTEAARFGTDLSLNLPNASSILKVNGTQVVSTRKTGWTAMTGTATRTGYATSTATLANVAEALKALTDDLRSHGLIN